jgi:hypothetical protein
MGLTRLKQACSVVEMPCCFLEQIDVLMFNKSRQECPEFPAVRRMPFHAACQNEMELLFLS